MPHTYLAHLARPGLARNQARCWLPRLFIATLIKVGHNLKALLNFMNFEASQSRPDMACDGKDEQHWAACLLHPRLPAPGSRVYARKRMRLLSSASHHEAGWICMTPMARTVLQSAVVLWVTWRFGSWRASINAACDAAAWGQGFRMSFSFKING